MFSSKERFIRASDIDKASMDFLNNGTVPDKIYGEVVWDSLRAREFIRRPPEEIALHNAAVSENISSGIIFRRSKLSTLRLAVKKFL